MRAMSSRAPPLCWNCSQVPGLTCMPVMLVQPLSMMMSVKGTWCCTALTRPGKPAWKKVESPMVAITGVLTPAWTKPCANGDAGAHGDFIPDGIEGRVHAQDGAADVAGHHHLVLLEAGPPDGLVDRHEGAAVRAAGADGDRTGGRQLLRLGACPCEQIGRDRQAGRRGEALHHLAQAVIAYALELPAQLADDVDVDRPAQAVGLDVESLLDVRLQSPRAPGRCRNDATMPGSQLVGRGWTAPRRRTETAAGSKP